MSRSGRLVFAALLAGLALSPATASAQARVAQLKRVSGKVTVTRSESGKIDEARQAGPRVQNGSVFGGDVVATDPAAAAVMVFTDGSEVSLEESTQLTVREIDYSAQAGAGTAEKPVGRSIRVLAGNVLSKIVPNPEVATEFETPSGVAAIKGTTVRVGVGQDKSVSFGATQGTFDFTSPQTGLIFTVGPNDQATLAPSAGAYRVDLAPGSGQSMYLTLSDGRRLEAGAGTQLRTLSEGGGIHLSVLGGVISFADKSTLGPGGSTIFPASLLPSRMGASMSLSVEKGAVALNDPMFGLEASIGDGYTLQVAEKQGRLELTAPASNPGPITLRIGNRKVVASPGSGLSVSAGGSFNVTSGKVTSGAPATGDTQGNRQAQRPVACGECSVPDGAGGCTDVSSLCPDLPCLKNRVCAAGRCVGGTRPTSREDPNCR